MNAMRTAGLLAAGLCALGAAARGQSVGADVIVSDIPDTANFTPTGAVGGIRAYAIGTTACNIGDADLGWHPHTNQHPVIAQNIYRLAGGRFEQIGQAWVKNGFYATNESDCGTCNAPGGHALKPGCSDTYWAGLNGQQNKMGPKSEVNASTGDFPYPWINDGCGNTTVLCKRLQVAEADLLSATSGATYFVAGMYVHPDDAQAHNSTNNESYRQVLVGAPPAMDLTLTGPTQATEPAILAWADHVPGVTVSYADVIGDGRFIVASKATALSTGGYHYEYAVQNLSSDRSARSLSVPLAAGVVIASAGFHDVPYHSGEPYDGTDWTAVVSASGVTWSTQTYAENPDANALRWDTIYNFRFDSSAAPTAGSVSLGLFKPGVTVTPVVAAAVVPGS